jgi:DNA polymerase epsilon subunit 1
MLRGVICEECTAERDIDLCRDASLLPPSTTTSSAVALPIWKCEACATPYDLLRIEEQLVSDVQRLLLEWSVQDLKCGKCKRLRSNEFMEHCACAGEWVATKDRADIRRRLNVYRGVGALFGLRMLEGVVDECLEGF